MKRNTIIRSICVTLVSISLYGCSDVENPVAESSDTTVDVANVSTDLQDYVTTESSVVTAEEINTLYTSEVSVEESALESYYNNDPVWNLISENPYCFLPFKHYTTEELKWDDTISCDVTIVPIITGKYDADKYAILCNEFIHDSYEDNELYVKEIPLEKFGGLILRLHYFEGNLSQDSVSLYWEQAYFFTESYIESFSLSYEDSHCSYYDVATSMSYLHQLSDDYNALLEINGDLFVVNDAVSSDYTDKEMTLGRTISESTILYPIFDVRAEDIFSHSINTSIELGD